MNRIRSVSNKLVEVLHIASRGWFWVIKCLDTVISAVFHVLKNVWTLFQILLFVYLFRVPDLESHYNFRGCVMAFLLISFLEAVFHPHFKFLRNLRDNWLPASASTNGRLLSLAALLTLECLMHLGLLFGDSKRWLGGLQFANMEHFHELFNVVIIEISLIRMGIRCIKLNQILEGFGKQQINMESPQLAPQTNSSKNFQKVSGAKEFLWATIPKLAIWIIHFLYSVAVAEVKFDNSTLCFRGLLWLNLVILFLAEIVNNQVSRRMHYIKYVFFFIMGSRLLLSLYGQFDNGLNAEILYLSIPYFFVFVLTHVLLAILIFTVTIF